MAERQTLKAHAERPAGIDRGVDAAALEDLRVDHAGAEHLDPALALAGGAADSILYMEDGRICERGDHASLMARGGRYAALFCAQRELEQGYLELIKEAQA